MSEPGFDRALSTGEWTQWFKAQLAPPEMSVETLLACLHHFADLGLFAVVDEEHYMLAARGETAFSAECVRRELEALAESRRGFAVRYFLGQAGLDLAAVLKEAEASASPARAAKAPEPASDLSNLQIVRKVGRQLRPFLDLEKAALALLQGPHTSKADAQKIFHYLLSHTQMKAPARKWEQLSRKRHR